MFKEWALDWYMQCIKATDKVEDFRTVYIWGVIQITILTSVEVSEPRCVPWMLENDFEFEPLFPFFDACIWVCENWERNHKRFSSNPVQVRTIMLYSRIEIHSVSLKIRNVSGYLQIHWKDMCSKGLNGIAIWVLIRNFVIKGTDSSTKASL